MYSIEKYQTQERFNNRYIEIRKFLQRNADKGHNEHFHCGRLNWMMAHPYLDAEMLPQIASFKDSYGAVVGVVTFDTSYRDGWYILHSVSDEKLLRQMIEYICGVDSAPIIKANLDDIALCKLLQEENYKMQYSESVLTMDLSRDLYYRLPTGFCINVPNEQIDKRQWQLVIHRGFDNDGLPQTPSDEVAQAQKHLLAHEYVKTFVIKDGEYIAHCGVWFDGGETAYIEPVVTVSECRGKGLGRAVVYEALLRVKNIGAKRAVVLSDQSFYFHIGMQKSSTVGAFVK